MSEEDDANGLSEASGGVSARVSGWIRGVGGEAWSGIWSAGREGAGGGRGSGKRGGGESGGYELG